MRSLRHAVQFLSRHVPAVRWSRDQARKLAAQRRFAGEFQTFRALAATTAPRFRLEWRDRYPCLSDRTAIQGFDRHYVFHTGWAARVLARTRPSLHIDISSSLYFCSIVSAFVPIRFFDYRPAALGLSGLSSERADLTNLPFEDRSIESLSCMHVVEHVGLGRYGDPLDPEGDLKSMSELQRVVAPGGSLLFVVPIGRPVVRFNAHRVYSYRQIVEVFRQLDLEEWALVPDEGDRQLFVTNAPEEIADQQQYGCGCFWFTRKPA
jgi:SAM-dependent methyltransferase